MRKLSQRFEYSGIDIDILTIATQNENRKQLSCLSLCICLYCTSCTQHSHAIKFLFPPTCVLPMCVTSFCSLFLNDCITTFSSFILLTVSHLNALIHMIYSYLWHLQQYPLRSITLLAIFNNL